MAEHLETFTIDARRTDVRDLCVKYLTGFKYNFLREDDQSLVFEKGSKRKNFYTFSFEEAYKRVRLLVVGGLEFCFMYIGRGADACEGAM